MRCEEIGPQLPAFVRGELVGPESADVERHLVECPSCRAEAEAFRRVGAMLDEAGLGFAPPSGLKDATFARVQAEDLGVLLSGAAAASPPADLKQRAMSRALTGRDADRGARRPRRGTLLTAVAAIAVIGIAAGSQMRVQDLDRRLATMRASVQRAEDSLGPIGHPMQAVQLAGTGAQAEAELVHFRHDNYRMTVDIADMEVTPPDHHYEMWVAGDDGEVSVGSFRVKWPDDLTLSFTMGVDPGEFPEVLITLEPSDGDPSMSSDLVARATLDRNAIYHGPYEK